jgi:CRISPR system Cascade subunit CasC
MFVELHIIQNFPPSNLNRDDLGQPKDTDFGGYRRARISSQCLKRATRYARRNPDTGKEPLFQKYTGVPLSARTKRIRHELKERLVKRGLEPNTAEQAARLFTEAYAKKQLDDRETPTLIFFADEEFEWAADQLLKLGSEDPAAFEIGEPVPEQEAAPVKGKKKAAKQESPAVVKLANQLASETAKRTGAPDIALFGRMLADRPSTNLDAACQVAHAISTHAIDGRTPIDYYTAIDDLKTDPGAGFLDVAYFNSACFYRYARIDFAQLKFNLGDDHDLACRSVEAFLRASEAAIPGGKKNAFAHECRPSFMLAILRSSESDGWNLVNAFQKPVHAQTEGDLTAASVKRLEKQFKHLSRFYGDETVKNIAVALPDGTVESDQLDERFRAAVHNMQGWVGAICNPLRQGG